MPKAYDSKRIDTIATCDICTIDYGPKLTNTLLIMPFKIILFQIMPLVIPLKTTVDLDLTKEKFETSFFSDVTTQLSA